MTSASVCRLTRSAVRWRMPVSAVGSEASGTRCTFARRMLSGILVEDDGAVHLGELEQALRRERRVDDESAVAEPVNAALVADDDERTGAGGHDVLEALAQVGAGRHCGECREKQVLGRPGVDCRPLSRVLLIGDPRPDSATSAATLPGTSSPCDLLTASTASLTDPIGRTAALPPTLAEDAAMKTGPSPIRPASPMRGRRVRPREPPR